jgi:hypothetical protein
MENPLFNWHIGQKIVCIDDHYPNPPYYGEKTPKKDSIYTIRGICDSDVEEAPAFHLFEIVNKPNIYNRNDGSEVFGELYFWSFRFRPLQNLLSEDSVDISVFHKILADLPQLKTNA